MKDLDFDEIDRAVNSVISNTSSNDAKSEPAKSVTPPLTVQPISVPPSDITPPVIARRTSGHFMDVVHPSSDMRRSPINIPERAASVAIPPASNNLTPPQIQPQVDPQTHLETPPSTNENLIPSSPAPTKDSYNDEDIDKISDEISKELGQQTESAIESPFISGTKVEKRPLGAFSDDSAAETVKEVEQKADADFAPNPVAEKPFSPESTPLPAELSSDLLQIESDSTTVPEATSSTDDAVAAKDELTDKPEANKLTDAKSADLAAEVSVETNPELKVPPDSESTTKQKDSKPPAGDRDSGAIYDTNSYHKALVHPIKTKPRLMWVAYVAILLVVGAGVGAAVFFFVIPLINGL